MFLGVCLTVSYLIKKNQALSELTSAVNIDYGSRVEADIGRRIKHRHGSSCENPGSQNCVRLP